MKKRVEECHNTCTNLLGAVLGFRIKDSGTGLVKILNSEFFDVIEPVLSELKW